MTRAALDHAALAALGVDGTPTWALRALGHQGRDGGRLRAFTGDERRYIAAAARRLARIVRDHPLSARAGQRWYGDALRDVAELAEAHGLKLDHAVVATAHASAGRAWASNLDAVRASIMVARDGLTARQAAAELGLPVGMTGYAPIERAARALQARDPWTTLNGPKVTAFAVGIRSGGITHAVCIDGHAVNAADGLKADGYRAPITAARAMPSVAYDAVAAAYATAAYLLSRDGDWYHPAQVQASVWVAWRNIPTRRLPRGAR